MIPLYENPPNLFSDNITHRHDQLQNNACAPQTIDMFGYRNFITQHPSHKANMQYQYFRYPPMNQLTGADCKQEIEKVTLSCAQVWLEHQALWRRFSMSGNEMIITKMGRRMFPVLTFGVFNLSLNGLYSMEVEVVPADNNRYKYVSVSGWRVNGVASEQEGNKRMIHPDGIQNGEYWQRNGVAFKRIKLTNKKTAKEGSNQIVLNSMHKYQLQLVIKEIDENNEVIDTKKALFKETAFIAVTAYQNDDITQLKIDHNPFAKAFRDTNADVNSEHPGSPDDIYSLSPKRRRYSEYSMYTPVTQTLYPQTYMSNYKQPSAFTYNNYFTNPNFNTTPTLEDDKLFRKHYETNYGQYYTANERAFTTPSTTMYSTMNTSPTTQTWFSQAPYTSTYSNDLTGRLTHDILTKTTETNEDANNNTNNEYWTFPSKVDLSDPQVQVQSQTQLQNQNQQQPELSPCAL